METASSTDRLDSLMKCTVDTMVMINQITRRKQGRPCGEISSSFSSLKSSFTPPYAIVDQSNTIWSIEPRIAHLSPVVRVSLAAYAKRDRALRAPKSASI